MLIDTSSIANVILNIMKQDQSDIDKKLMMKLSLLDNESKILASKFVDFFFFKQEKKKNSKELADELVNLSNQAYSYAQSKGINEGTVQEILDEIS